MSKNIKNANRCPVFFSTLLYDKRLVSKPFFLFRTLWCKRQLHVHVLAVYVLTNVAYFKRIYLSKVWNPQFLYCILIILFFLLSKLTKN